MENHSNYDSPASIMIINYTAATIYNTGYLALNSIYVVFGFLDTLFNGVVSLVIFSSRSLRSRKELFLVGLFTSADILVGLSYLGLGARRLLLYANSDLNLLTPLECMQVIPVNLLLLSLQLMSLMLLAISFDRFLFIINPTLYMKLGLRYQFLVAGIPMAIAGGGLITAWISVATQIPNVRNQYPSCVVIGYVPYWFYLYDDFLQLFGSGFAVILYGVILILLRYKKTLSSKFVALKQRQVERQRRLTKSLSIMAGATLIAFVTPKILLSFPDQLSKSVNGSQVVAQSLTAIISMHSLFNILCYLSRPSDIRTQLVNVALCRHLQVFPVQNNAASPNPNSLRTIAAVLNKSR